MLLSKLVIEKGINIFKINDEMYKLKFSPHAFERMTERNIKLSNILSSFIKLGPKNMFKIKNWGQRRIAIANKDKNIGILFIFHKNEIRIITVLDKYHFYLKPSNGLIRIIDDYIDFEIVYNYKQVI